MKNTFKHLMGITLSASMVITMMPTMAMAEENNEIVVSGFCGAEENADQVIWSLSADETLTISGVGPMCDYESLEEIPWGQYSDMILKVSVEDGVTSIGKYAFCNLPQVMSLEIPASVQSIGDYAVGYTQDLTVVEGFVIQMSANEAAKSYADMNQITCEDSSSYGIEPAAEVAAPVTENTEVSEETQQAAAEVAPETQTTETEVAAETQTTETEVAAETQTTETEVTAETAQTVNDGDVAAENVEAAESDSVDDLTATDGNIASDEEMELPSVTVNKDEIKDLDGSLWDSVNNDSAEFDDLSDIEMFSSSVNEYHGNNLSGTTKKMYNAMRSCSATSPKASIIFTDANILSTYQKYYNMAQIAWAAITYDYPEQFFFSTDITFTIRYTSSGQVTFNMIFSISSYYNSTLGANFTSALNDMVAGVPSGSYYTQAKYIHDWICQKAVYDYDALTTSSQQRFFYAHGPQGCLLNGTGVCESYAELFKAACNKLSIPCVIVVSSTHAWNYVQMENGQWYMVDCTWDDNDNGSYGYNYFLISNNPAIDSEHTPETLLSYPTTSATAYNTPTSCSKPTNVKAASTGYNSVKVSWTVPSGATGVKVYKATSGSSSYSLVATVAKTSSAKTITGLTTGTKYCFKVRAYITYNGSNIYSGYTSAVSATPTLTKATNIKVTSTASKTVKVTWTVPSGATGVKIYRSTSSSGSYSLVATVSKSSTSKTFTSLTSKKKYYYKVRAYRVVNGKTYYSGYTSAYAVTVK